LPERVSAAEILVDAIPVGRREVRFRSYSALPPIVADLTFAQPRTVAWEAIEEFTRSLDLANLESVKLVDRYEGRGVGPEEVKTTLRLTFRSADRTLAQEEVNRERDRLAAALTEKFGVTI
jgi:phenylalanyl-tRNA synthetase beta subunit